MEQQPYQQLKETKEHIFFCIVSIEYTIHILATSMGVYLITDGAN